MGGVASHCHERLTNTKKGKGNGREWRKMEKKGNEKLQISGSLSNGFALALGAQWMEWSSVPSSSFF